MASGALWAVDVGETSIWTIVGTDQVRYNFYVPPALFDPALGKSVTKGSQANTAPFGGSASGSGSSDASSS